MFIFLLEKWPLFQEEPGDVLSLISELSGALFRRQLIFKFIATVFAAWQWCGVLSDSLLPGGVVCDLSHFSTIAINKWQCFAHVCIFLLHLLILSVIIFEQRDLFL